MLGLMMPTWFLSMWISNTATTAMMVPIANAILLQLRDTNKSFDKGMGDPIGHSSLYRLQSYVDIVRYQTPTIIGPFDGPGRN